MECKRLPKVYEIENFSLKIILLIKNSGLIVSLKYQKTCQKGQVAILYGSARLNFTFLNLLSSVTCFLESFNYDFI